MYLLLLLYSCRPIEIGDSDWKLEALYQDNWRFLYRDSDLLQDKFRVMSNSPYSFMRGSLSISLGHVKRISQQREMTQFLTLPEATLIPLIGDPHPENLTVCADPSQEPSIEFIDLDASEYGPWLLDLRRAAASTRLFSSLIDGCDCEDLSVQSLVDGYLKALGGDDVDLFSLTIFERLLLEAEEEGLERKKFQKYTRDGKIVRDTERDASGKAILSIGPEEEDYVRELFSVFQGASGSRVLDIARRYGMGVSSLPAFRYVVLWQEEGRDAELSLLREVMDPPEYPRPDSYQPVFENNADRVDQLRYQLWENPTANPDYGAVLFGGIGVKRLRWSSFFQDVELEKIQKDWREGSLIEQDIAQLGFAVGFVLGKAHSRTVGISGRSSREIIQRDIQIGGGEQRLFVEIQTISTLDLEQLIADYDWFRNERDAKGELLGMGVWQ